MPDIIKPYDYIADFVTGKKVPKIGSEANRQKVERFLVPLSEIRLEKEKLIFRTYDMANVNVHRNL